METHDRVKYYGYLGADGTQGDWDAPIAHGNSHFAIGVPLEHLVPGKETGIIKGAQGKEEAQACTPLDDAKKERMKAMLRTVLEEVKTKRVNQG